MLCTFLLFIYLFLSTPSGWRATGLGTGPGLLG